MTPRRILQVFGEPLANGGQESYIMNMYRHIDRERIQFDFFTPFTVDNLALQQEIEALGGRVYAAGHPFGVDNNRFFRRGLTAFLTGDKPYTVVHIHSGSTYALSQGAKAARRRGIPHVIVHSHCGGFDNLRYRVIRLLSRRALTVYPTQRFACSHLAARWKYPTPLIRHEQYRVLHNAVDTAVFRYDPALRRQYRREWGLEGHLVVGHVGRFAVQKNHRFLIDTFAALSQTEPSARLVLVGDGEEQNAVRQQVTSLGLTDRVDFYGIRQDVPALMNAFDVLVLPSFYEGLPVVGVEALATGLPVVASTGITPELPVPERTVYKPLADGPTAWAQAILEAARLPREDTTALLKERGYDVRTAAAILQQAYEEMV
ncbi:MAG: glycosyltransferase family 1 protein [Ruminococcaceae bacterium]|nr:glycosyltransferase family 1 protein [Oscillospiraceae bacterium]